MGESPRVLVVEDDPQTRQLIAAYLGGNAFDVSVAANAAEADRVLRSTEIDLVVLDRMLPGESGLDFCRRLYGSPLSVIMLTALSEDIERIVGLEAGADDYLGKPFNPRELLARIRAVLRRSAQPHPPRAATGTHVFSGFALDLGQRRLYGPTGARIFLTGAEFELLRVLCENAGRTLSREELVEATRGSDAAEPGRSVDILVSRLRRKIEEDSRDPRLIITMRASGYMLAGPVSLQ